MKPAASAFAAARERRRRRLSDGQVAELLANPLVEARPGQLGEAGAVVGEGSLERVAGRQLAGVAAVDGDVGRLASGGVADVENVGRGDDERACGQRVRRYVADDVALHAPGQDRP